MTFEEFVDEVNSTLHRMDLQGDFVEQTEKPVIYENGTLEQATIMGITAKGRMFRIVVEW